MRRLASSDLLFRYVEEVSDLSAARIRRYQKFELEASSPSPLIGTISTSRRVSALPDLEWFLSHIRSGRRADVQVVYHGKFGSSQILDRRSQMMIIFHWQMADGR